MIREIEIDTARLASDIENLRIELSTITDDLNKMYDAVAHLDTMWDGPANAAFVAQFSQDREEMIELCTVLGELNSSLVYAKDEYNNCENQVNAIVTAIRI